MEQERIRAFELGKIRLENETKVKAEIERAKVEAAKAETEAAKENTTTDRSRRKSGSSES